MLKLQKLIVMRNYKASKNAKISKLTKRQGIAEVFDSTVTGL